MPKVKFSKEFTYRPSKEIRITTIYRAGPKAQVVNEECARQAVAGGFGKVVETRSGKGGKNAGGGT